MTFRNVLSRTTVPYVLVAALCAQAQTAPPSPAQAPLPSALTTAKRLFIGNAGDQQNADCLRAYNSFYADLSGLARYILVSDPNQADVVLELHYEIDSDNVGNDSNNSVRQFRIVLEDPHSRVVLWTLIERTNYAVFKKNRNKNLDEVVAKLASDVGSLLSPQPVAPDNNSITRHGKTILPIGASSHE